MCVCEKCCELVVVDLQLKCRLDRIERRMSLCSQKQQTLQHPTESTAARHAADHAKSTTKFV